MVARIPAAINVGRFVKVDLTQLYPGLYVLAVLLTADILRIWKLNYSCIIPQLQDFRPFAVTETQTTFKQY